MNANPTATQAYPFDASWKAKVDHESPEWMAYCEAVTAIKQYLRTRQSRGREAAVEEFETMCQHFAKNNARGAARVERIRRDFKIIWAHERHEIAVEVARENEQLRQAA